MNDIVWLNNSNSASHCSVYRWVIVAACSVVSGALAADVRPAFGQSVENQADFRFEKVNDHSLELWQGKQPVLVYNFGQIKRTGAAAAGNRASYVHPIYGLDGEVLTDDFPKDHYHHHGLFWGWPHVTIGGKDYDFWKMHGTEIKFKRWLSKEADAKGATLAVENEWMVGDKPVVREEARLFVHPATAEGRLMDVRLKWTPLDQAITLAALRVRVTVDSRCGLRRAKTLSLRCRAARLRRIS